MSKRLQHFIIFSFACDWR
eukprot:Gb_09074 [translate_table: standard]